MFWKRKERPLVTKENAMNGIPVHLPVLKQEVKGTDLFITILCDRPRWQVVLGAQKTCEHTFCLDMLGKEVYEMCNGKDNVKEIVADFASKHNISIAEAEMSITQYLRTLMMKGLVAIQLPK